MLCVNKEVDTFWKKIKFTRFIFSENEHSVYWYEIISVLVQFAVSIFRC